MPARSGACKLTAAAQLAVLIYAREALWAERSFFGFERRERERGSARPPLASVRATCRSIAPYPAAPGGKSSSSPRRERERASITNPCKNRNIFIPRRRVLPGTYFRNKFPPCSPRHGIAKSSTAVFRRWCALLGRGCCRMLSFAGGVIRAARGRRIFLAAGRRGNVWGFRSSLLICG